jgi:hypothetical protein
MKLGTLSQLLQRLKLAVHGKSGVIPTEKNLKSEPKVFAYDGGARAGAQYQLAWHTGF